MNEKSINILEYNKIIERLVEKASSIPGKELCLKLAPMTDSEAIRKALAETSDAVARIFRGGNLTFRGLTDIGMSIKSLEIGSTLGISELLNIKTLLGVTKNALKYDGTEESNQDSLSHYFSELNPLDEIYKEINRCIIAEDEISDDASSTLKHIRKQKVLAGERIKSELSKMLTGNERTYLQETVITTRNGRYCIPVKAEYKSQVPGMVHDQSKAGSTYFIEPALDWS